MTAPDPEIFQGVPLELLDRVYSVWQASSSPMPPHPYEILAYPSDFLDKLLKYDEGVRFEIDRNKRPEWLK